MIDWIKVLISPGTSLFIPKQDHHRFQILAAVSCDLLWFYRNKAFHDGVSFDALQLSRNVNKIYQHHSMAWTQLSTPLIEKWIHPPDDWFKINFDTAIREDFSAQAVVCRNHKGQIIDMVSQINFHCSPNLGEALAAHLAILLASSLHLKNFIFEGDSQTVILALQQPTLSQDWRISNTIYESIGSIPAGSSWSAWKVNRSANFCTHYAAHWAAAKFIPGSIPTYPSPTFSIPIVSGNDPP
jgi:hypothetical protein